MAFDAAAIAGVAEYQASLMDAESRFQAAKSRLLSLIRTSMDQVTAATTEAVVSSGGIPSAYTTGYRANDGSTVITSSNEGGLMSPNRLPSRGGPGPVQGNNNSINVDPQKQKEMEMEKFERSLPLLQPVNPRHHKHATTTSANPTNNNRNNRIASGKRRDDSSISTGPTTNESSSSSSSAAHNTQTHTSSSDTNASSSHTTSAKGRSRRLAEGVAYGRNQGDETGSTNNNNNKDNNGNDYHHDTEDGNDLQHNGGGGRRKSRESIDHKNDDPLHNNPLGGPVHSKTHNNTNGKDERKPKDFDLRLGPAYTTDMEKLRARQAVEWRAKREEAHTRLVMLSSTLANKQGSTNTGTTISTATNGTNKDNSTGIMNKSTSTSRSSNNNPSSQHSQQSRQSRNTSDPNDPVSSPRTDFATAYPLTSSVFGNFGVTDNGNLPSPPVLFGQASHQHQSLSNPNEWNIPSLSGSPTTNNIIMSMQQTAEDNTGYPSMIPYDFQSQFHNPAYGSMFPPSSSQVGPMMMDANGQPMGFIHPETGVLLPFGPPPIQSFIPPYPNTGNLPGQGYAQTPSGTVSGAQILEHMNAVANTQRRVGTANGRLRSDPSNNTKYQTYDTVNGNDKKNSNESSSSSAFRTTGKQSISNPNNPLRNSGKPTIRKVSANKMNNKSIAPLAATSYVNPSTMNNTNTNNMIYPSMNYGLPTTFGPMDPSLMMMNHPYPPVMLPPMMHSDQENNGDAERKRNHTGSSDSSDQTMVTDNNGNAMYPSSHYLNGVLPTTMSPQHYVNTSPSHYHHSQQQQQQHSPIQQILGTGNLLNISSQANAIVKYELSLNRTGNKNSPLSPIEHVDDEHNTSPEVTTTTKTFSRVLAPSDAIAAANNRAQAAVAASRNNDALRTPIRTQSDKPTNNTDTNQRTTYSSRPFPPSSSGVLDRSFPLASPTSIDSTPDHKSHYAGATDDAPNDGGKHLREATNENDDVHNESTGSTDISGLDLSSSETQLLSPTEGKENARLVKDEQETKEDQDDNQNNRKNNDGHVSVPLQQSFDESLSGDVDEHLRLMMMDQPIDNDDQVNALESIPVDTEVFPLPVSSLSPPSDIHKLGNTSSLNESFDDSKLADEITNALAKEIIMEIDAVSRPGSTALSSSQPTDRTIPPSFELVPSVTAALEESNNEESAYVRSNIVLSIPTHDALEDSIDSNGRFNYVPNNKDQPSNDHLELQAQAVEALMWQGPSSNESNGNGTDHQNNDNSNGSDNNAALLRLDEEKSSNISNTKHSAIIGARGASPINA